LNDTLQMIAKGRTQTIFYILATFI